VSAPEFTPFPKIPRLTRECIITEKIDGTNASILISEDGTEIYAGSRNRWLLPGQSDNFGFAAWVEEHREELIPGLGAGHHFGEWWGSKIGRGYGLTNGDRRFSLFNVSRWESASSRPACCDVVPVLYRGEFDTDVVEGTLELLALHGSQAAPGFMRPEGVVIFHVAGNLMFKKTIENDGQRKGESQ